MIGQSKLCCPRREPARRSARAALASGLLLAATGLLAGCTPVRMMDPLVADDAAQPSTETARHSTPAAQSIAAPELERRATELSSTTIKLAPTGVPHAPVATDAR